MIDGINKYILRNRNRNGININTYSNGLKGLIFVIIYINVSLIVRAKSLIEYLDKYVIINNNNTLEVLKFVKFILKLIIILIKI